MQHDLSFLFSNHGSVSRMIFGGLMPNKPWRMFLVLLSVVLIALSSGLIVKSMILKALDQQLAAGRMDLARAVASDIGAIVQIGSFLTAGLVFASMLLLSRTRDERDRKPAQVSAGSSRKNMIKGLPSSHQKEVDSPDTVQESPPREELALSVAAAGGGTPEAVQDEPTDPDDEDMQQN